MQTISTRDVSCELHHFLMEYSQAEDNKSISRLYHRFASGFLPQVENILFREQFPSSHTVRKQFPLLIHGQKIVPFTHTLLENSSLYSYTVRKQFPFSYTVREQFPSSYTVREQFPLLIHGQKIVPFTHTLLENSSLYSYTVRKQFPFSYTVREQFPSSYTV